MAVPTPIASLVTVTFCWILHLSLLLGASFLVSPFVATQCWVPGGPTIRRCGLPGWHVLFARHRSELHT